MDAWPVTRMGFARIGLGFGPYCAGMDVQHYHVRVLWTSHWCPCSFAVISQKA